MLPSQHQIFISVAVLLCWLLPRPVHTFSHPLVILNPHVGTPDVATKRAKRAHTWQSIDTALHQATKGEASLRREKVTKEAAELLDVICAREEGSGPELLVAQVAPSVRVAISEAFCLPPGAVSAGELVAALKELGFDLVLDITTAADLTICEEGTELLHRLKAQQEAKYRCKEQKLEKGGAEDAELRATSMPLFTSCCPGWLQFVEKSAPELTPYISSCKSPHLIKRGESDRPVFTGKDGVREVDNVITTRDLGQLFHKKQIDPSKMEPMQFDSPFQQIDGTGAGQLFGATGGVMEAAVRTVYSLVMGKEMPRLELTELRGLEGVKEATVPLCLNNDDIGSAIDLKVAVVSGLGNAKKLIRKLKDGEVHYDFVEIMACPGGCINGGGQPPITHSEKDTNVVEQRLQAIYSLDRSLPLRQSHENPTVEALYSQYLKDGYGGKEAHRLLHVEPVYGKTPEMKPEISDDGRDENK